MAAQESLRPEMVQIAENFLKSHIVKNHSSESVRNFLSSKGLSNAEIEKAFTKFLEFTQKASPISAAAQRQGSSTWVRVLALFSKFRDFCNFAFFAVAAFYGLHFLYENYLRPWLTGRPPPPSSDLQSPQTENIESLAASVNEMKKDVAALRSMLLKRTNFTATPPVARSIPEWQKNGHLTSASVAAATPAVSLTPTAPAVSLTPTAPTVSLTPTAPTVSLTPTPPPAVCLTPTPPPAVSLTPTPPPAPSSPALADTPDAATSNKLADDNTSDEHTDTLSSLGLPSVASLEKLAIGNTRDAKSDVLSSSRSPELMAPVRGSADEDSVVGVTEGLSNSNVSSAATVNGV
ncbi:Peroxisome membrane anchor protein Pex14p N-terminal [Trinorchestia longiramus]|nr:Peroxisome membrane anchor protein Pex14p N-terminal [Trinorchestia longiramus]